MHTLTQTFSTPAAAKSFVFNLGQSIGRGPKFQEIKTSFAPMLTGCTAKVSNLTERGLKKAKTEAKKAAKSS
jgi:hypothetical protein